MISISETPSRNALPGALCMVTYPIEPAREDGVHVLAILGTYIIPLRNHQGMFGNRLPVYRNVMQRIIGFCCTATGTAQDLAAITPEAVFAFLDGDAGKAGWCLPYVRNILRFLFWSGRTPRDLSDAIPAARGGRPHGSSRHLKASVVHKLLEAVRGDCAIDLRDHAMLSRYDSTTSTGARARCWSAAKVGSSTVCRPLWTSAKPSSLGCATRARGARATCSSAYARRMHRSHHRSPCVARFAKRTAGRVSSRPAARCGPMPCDTASPWRCWTGERRSGRSAMSCATAAPGRQRPMQGTTTGRCVHWPARGRCREVDDEPGRRTRGTVSRPAGVVRNRPLAQCGSGTEEVRRLRGGRESRPCDHGAVPALEGPAPRGGEPADLVLPAQPCAHLRALATEPGAANGGAAPRPRREKPQAGAAVHLHRR